MMAGPTPVASELVERAAQSLVLGGWEVFRAESVLAAQLHVRSLISEHDEIALHAVPLWSAIGAGPASEAGVAVRPFSSEPAALGDQALTREDVRQVLARCSLGVTGATAVVAESGTVLLSEDDGFGRLVSNLPYRHLVLTESSRVVESLDEALAVVRLEAQTVLGKALPRYVSAISGPSRTGDIQMEIVKGMHGPGEAHIILLDASVSGEQGKADL